MNLFSIMLIRTKITLSRLIWKVLIYELYLNYSKTKKHAEWPRKLLKVSNWLLIRLVRGRINQNDITYGSHAPPRPGRPLTPAGPGSPRWPRSPRSPLAPRSPWWPIFLVKTRSDATQPVYSLCDLFWEFKWADFHQNGTKTSFWIT